MRNNDFGDADYFSTDFNIEFIIIFLINLFIIYLFTDIAGVFRRDGSMNKNRLHLGFVTFLFSLLFSLCLSYFLLFLIISLSIIWICMLVDKRSIHLHSFFWGGGLGLYMRLGILTELQFLAYATATASQDPNWFCDLHHSYDNARSLTHLSRQGFEPASSWIPIGFITAEPWQNSLSQNLLAWNNKKNLLSHTVAVVRLNLTRWFWLEISDKIGVKILLWL